MLVSSGNTRFPKKESNQSIIGEVAEWSNAAVLKTVDLHGSGGSNPSLSAKKKPSFFKGGFFYTLGSAE
ncbi:MAG: hypothetical protein PWR04_1634 [Anaerophaga sp.]|nr:hypothetical protein [Anaerophaga sp.]